MATPMAAAEPVYFEESWAILSSIGLVNVIFGFLVVGITSLSPMSLVPIVVSAAGAIANGLCYYAFYAHYPKTSTVAAAAVADIAWLVQEAGMSFYSYLILIRVLRQRDRRIFMGLFWSLMTILVGIRTAILVTRARQIITGKPDLQKLVDHLHIGYFGSIALIEIISSVFLLRKFAAARRTSLEAAPTSGLFKYLMQSTEIRLATLALIGITRAITYSFQETAQSATTTPSQVDRFAFTLECVFPTVMFIDILASKLVVANHIHGSSTQRAYAKSNTARKTAAAMGPLYSMSNIETRDNTAALSSSQERIVEGQTSGSGTYEVRDCSGMGKGAVINETVEFEFHVSGV